MHPYLEQEGRTTPIAFAHRGYSAQFPENTMAAFGAAVELGIRYLETDIQATSDDVAVIFHDDCLERLTGQAGKVSDYTWPELRQLLVKGSEPIPRLEDVLSAWPEIRINIDTKCDGVLRPFLEVMERHDAWNRVCAGSFSGRRIGMMRSAVGPRLCTSMGPLEVTRLRLASLGLPTGGFRANCVQVPVTHRGITVVDRSFVDKAHSLDLPVHVWTINDPEEMDRLLNLGVDGIMSDKAGLALAACSGLAGSSVNPDMRPDG